jgi:hypothetical protein
LLAQEPETAAGEQARRLGIPIADPNRLNALTVLYSELATSDDVRALIRKDGPLLGRIIAQPVVVGETRNLLPLIDLIAISTSPRQALELAQRGARAFTAYLREQQRVNEVPVGDRVVVQQLMRPRTATIFRSRSVTMPIVVFLAVMFATVALAFVLENLRRARREPPAETLPPAVDEARRRSA